MSVMYFNTSSVIGNLRAAAFEESASLSESVGTDNRVSHETPRKSERALTSYIEKRLTAHFL